jgi:hypothetical protein
VVTRRALLGAGALALLAGCGPEEEPEADVGQVLVEQLRQTQAVADAYKGVTGDGRATAQRRVARIKAVLVGQKLHGRAGYTVTVGDTGSPQAALAAEQDALRGHVAAVGQLKDPEYRELLAGLIADAAAGEAALLTTLDQPAITTAFPGEPV